MQPTRNGMCKHNQLMKTPSTLPGAVPKTLELASPGSLHPVLGPGSVQRFRSTTLTRNPSKERLYHPRLLEVLREQNEANALKALQKKKESVASEALCELQESE